MCIIDKRLTIMYNDDIIKQLKTEEVAEEAPDAVDDAAMGGGEEADIDIKIEIAAVTAPAPAAAPTTGDTSMILFMLTAICVAAVVMMITAKKVKVKNQ